MNKLLLSIDKIKALLYTIAGTTGPLSEYEILHKKSELINDSFYKLDKMASIPIEDNIVDSLLDDDELKPIIKEICRFRKIYNIRLELERAEQILKTCHPWKMVKEFNFYPNYIQLASMEVRGANLKPGQNVIFLGSGPLPLSLIILCSIYKLNGIGIEQKEEYVRISQKVISKLQIADRIKVIHGNHFSLKRDMNTDLIMIAAAAVPKDEIFSYLKRSMKSGTNVSYRIYEHGLRKLLDVDSRSVFEDQDKQLSYVEEYKRIIPKPPVNNTCVFGKL